MKNLAETFSMQGSDHHGEAVDCFLQASAIDGKDVVLWNRLGTLSCALGNLNIARRAFEEGLRCSPRHCKLCFTLMLSKRHLVADGKRFS